MSAVSDQTATISLAETLAIAGRYMDERQWFDYVVMRVDEGIFLKGYRMDRTRRETTVERQSILLTHADLARLRDEHDQGRGRHKWLRR